MATKFNEQDLLQVTLTEYNPNSAPPFVYGMWFNQHRMPPFTRAYIPHMRRDPRIKLGLSLLRGPVAAKARFRIAASTPQVLADVREIIDTFWSTSISKALSSVLWGYSAAEVLYELGEGGKVKFSGLRWVHPYDAEPVILDGEKVGIFVAQHNQRERQYESRIYIGGPKSFWTVHRREEDRWFGYPRVEGAFVPWMDKYALGGSADSVRLFFYKYAYRGPRIRYPQGTSNTVDQGQVDNRTLAMQIGRDIQNGSIAALPSSVDPNTNQELWQIEDPEVTASGTDLLEYDRHNDRKMLEGMEIPSEIIEAFASGSGYAGRAVPDEAYHSMLQPTANEIITDLDEQIIKPYVRFYHGQDAHYQITPLPILQIKQKEETKLATPDTQAEDTNGETTVPDQTQFSTPSIRNGRSNRQTMQGR